jgi:hypothetical protein
MTTAAPSTTALGGTLVRHGRDDWRWRDGASEPRARDLSPSAHYNLRCRAYADRQYVEVPRGLAQEEITWAHEGWAAGLYRTGDSGDRPGQAVILVPVEAWDSWSADHPVGCTWDLADQEAILARARTLGWEG